MTNEDPLKNFLFIDQLKIMGYGESDTSGCWLKLLITPELLEVVRGRKGEIVEVAARLIDNSGEYVEPGPAKAKPEESPHGKFWQQLIAFGTFQAPPVLQAIGTDQEFREWIQEQPSVLTGQTDWDEKLGRRVCEAAHVLRVSEGSGKAIKPDYFCVPLTHAEHLAQHQSGEQSRELFEKAAAKYRVEWASAALAQLLGYERRRDCPGDLVAEWFADNDLGNFLPEKLRAPVEPKQHGTG